jgi:hypothetical protein
MTCIAGTFGFKKYKYITNYYCSNKINITIVIAALVKLTSMIEMAPREFLTSVVDPELLLKPEQEPEPNHFGEAGFVSNSAPDNLQYTRLSSIFLFLFHIYNYII